MPKLTDGMTHPVRHQAGKILTEDDHAKQRLIRRLLILGSPVLPSLAFAECPRLIGASGVRLIDLYWNDLTTCIAWEFAPIFGCLILVLCIVATFETTRERIEPGPNKPQNPEHGTPKGIV